MYLSFDGWTFAPIIGLHIFHIYAVFIIKNVAWLHSTTSHIHGSFRGRTSWSPACMSSSASERSTSISYAKKNYCNFLFSVVCTSSGASSLVFMLPCLDYIASNGVITDERSWKNSKGRGCDVSRQSPRVNKGNHWNSRQDSQSSALYSNWRPPEQKPTLLLLTSFLVYSWTLKMEAGRNAMAVTGVSRFWQREKREQKQLMP